MSTNINLINDLRGSIKQLHDDIVGLMFRVTLIVDSKELKCVVRDVKDKTGHRLPTAIESANKVVDQLCAVTAAYVPLTAHRFKLALTSYIIIPTVIPIDHACAKGLRQLNYSIGSFLTTSNHISNLQLQDTEPEDTRQTTMAKQATDLHYAIRNMLLYVRGSEKLMEDVGGPVSAIEGAANVADDPADDAAASTTGADTPNSA